MSVRSGQDTSSSNKHMLYSHTTRTHPLGAIQLYTPFPCICELAQRAWLTELLSVPPPTAPCTVVGVATLVTAGLVALVTLVVAKAGLATKPGGGDGSDDV